MITIVASFGLLAVILAVVACRYYSQRRLAKWFVTLSPFPTLLGLVGPTLMNLVTGHPESNRDAAIILTRLSLLLSATLTTVGLLLVCRSVLTMKSTYPTHPALLMIATIISAIPLFVSVLYFVLFAS